MPTEPTSIPLWAALLGYLIGSIPFGLLLTRAAGMGDVRKIGSGNIGATNVLRTGNKGLAAGTLLLDLLKGLAPVLIAARLGGEVAAAFAAGAAVLGHCFPVWLGFKGGKGVATYAGLLPFVSLPGFFVAAPVWLGLFAITRISSLAALTAAALVAPGAWLLGERNLFIIGGLALLSLFVFWTHRANLGRLLKGEEPKFGAKKPDSPSA